MQKKPVQPTGQLLQNSIQLFLCVLLSSVFLISPSPRATAKCYQANDEKKARSETKNAHALDDQEEPEDLKSIIDTAAQSVPASIDDNQIKLHMWDGSIVTGKISVASIKVMTQFGQMTIPIKQIVSFYPGLESFPAKQAQLKKLVEELGDGSYQIREEAHRTLVKIGLPLQKEISKFSDGGSVERKKHLVEIQKELEELAEDMDDIDELTALRAITRQDRIVTPNMTVVGKIQEDLFVISSKFGELKVQLEDIEHASRNIDVAREDLRKKLTLNSDNFLQRKPKSTGIRVHKGDRIRIHAGGVMQWTNWNSSSTPEGLTNQGRWNSIQSGTLIAQIGKAQNSVIKVGAKEDWVAKKSGVLYLAIAIQDNYVGNQAYRWTGEYNAKVIVTPAKK